MFSSKIRLSAFYPLPSVCKKILRFVSFELFVFKNIHIRMANPLSSMSIRVPKTFIRGRKITIRVIISVR